jgi:hypothetical protein
MLFVSRKKNKLGWQDTTWNFATTERKKQIVNYVKSLGIDLKNKKILCVAGGVGRNANALTALCDNVTNSDYEDFYLNIGKKLYPNVNHINYDMNNEPLTGFDFVLFERCWSMNYVWEQFHYIDKWKGHAEIIPQELIDIKVFQFNSKLFKRLYHQEETIGNMFIQQEMSNAQLEGYIYHSEIEDLVVSDLQVSIDQFKFDVPACTNKNYQMLGTYIPGMDNCFRGIFINRGIKGSFNKHTMKFEYTTY